MRNNIKRAMDAHLSCLRASDASRAAILEKVRGGKTMKKKVSLGLVLALALTLIVIGALAAVILTNKDFVNNVLSPKALENTSDSWTQQEMDDILRMAADSGVALDQEALSRLQEKGAQYKEEVMRLFAKAQLGFYPSTWSIEDQAWYDQMLVDSGLKEERSCFVPEGDEITQQQALDIVLGYIHDQFDADAAVTDDALYRRHLQYVAYSDNPYQKGKQWYISYEPLDSTHSRYSFTVLSDGTVKEANREMGLAEEGRPALDANQVLDLYRDTYGAHDTWTMETWLAFQKEAAQAAQANPGTLSERVRSIIKQSYALPDSTAIPREEAVKAAGQAIASQGGRDEKALLEQSTVSAVYFTQEEGPLWKVSFQHKEDGQPPVLDTVELNACTGEIRYIALDLSWNSWADAYLLSSNPAVGAWQTQTEAAQTTARSDGKPKLWYSDAAPTYYWEALDAVGYNADTAGELMNGWISEYGTDTMFWPLTAQAIDAIWHNLGQNATVLPGLPAQGDISQEEAVTLAQNAFRQAQATRSQEWLDSLKTAVSFTFNTPQMGDRQWLIRFVSISGTGSTVEGYAALDAVTGTVEDASWAQTAAEAAAPAPTATLRPDGLPALWYSDRAPASFWQTLDAVGYTADTASQMEKEWAAAYGEDPAFWPLKQHIIWQLWHTDMSGAAIFSALPGEGDITEEAALKLAWETAHREYDAVVGADFLNTLKASVDFWDQVNGPVKRMWTIHLMEGSSGEGVFTVQVEIDAATGQVISITASRSNG